jgi:serine acetyltransferase
MSLVTKLRSGEGSFWSALKGIARVVLQFHLPASGLAKPPFRLLYTGHVAVREAVAFLLRLGWYEPLFRSQCEAVGDRFYMERLPYLTGNGRIWIGDGVRLSGKSSIGFSNRLHEKPELSIGDDTFIGHDCSFSVAEAVRIGRSCLIAGRTSISDFDGHPIDAARRRAGEPTPRDQIRPVTIGDDVWIGAGSAILKGVTIGDRSIVAARSVVAGDVPPDVIVAGDPARVVRRLADGESPSEPISHDERNRPASAAGAGP